MDYNEKLGKAERDIYQKYPHLQPQQPQQMSQLQYKQQEQQQQIEQQQIETDKRVVCDMLIDYYNKKHERLSTTYMVNTLYAILSRPLAAEDQMYYKKQLNAIENSIRPQQAPENFESAENMVNNKQHNHNKKGKNDNNSNKNS